MTRGAKIGLMIIVAIFGLALWVTFRETRGVDVASVWWLPRKASHITYIRNDTMKLAEFDIEQAAFERWCADQKMPLFRVVKGELPMISRSVGMLEYRGILPTILDPNDASGERHPRSNKVFRAGDLFYEQREANGGGYSIGYDVKEKRGYYEWAHH